MTHIAIIKEIENFLSTVEWTDYKRQRIQSILEKLPKEIVVQEIEKEKIKVVEKIRYVRKVHFVEVAPPKLFFPKSRLDEVAKVVCKQHKISVEELRSRSRSETLVIIRKEFYQRAREEYKASYPEIGRYVGRKHESVMYALGALNRKPKH